MAASKNSFSGVEREPALCGPPDAQVLVSALACAFPLVGWAPQKNSKAEERK
jgi:hypothetical protein